jgi:Amt family ammonium transporter
MHSLWALATGVAVIFLARDRYGFVPWVVLFLVLTWVSTLFFGGTMGGEHVGTRRSAPPGFGEEATSYLTRTMYQETLFFLLPFYWYSTVLQSLNLVLWILVGYSLAFGTGNAFVGDFSKAGLAGVTLDSATGTIPEYAFVMFQGMFAIITPALILGAIAERMRFSAWVVFITLWLLVVYCPLAHMVWSSEGWIFKSGAIDFAGGLVVHMSSGFSALVAALYLGKRKGLGREPMAPHNLPLCLVGAGLLWTGWFGFNAGSALGANPLATLAFLNTSTAASTAVVAWAAIEWLHRGKPTALGGATAAVAGLVAITPACAAVDPMGAILIGAGVAAISYAACTFLKPALGYDDSLDVFGVHALGGAWGALASGMFAARLGSDITSNSQQTMVQLEGIAFVLVFAPLATIAILLALNAAMGSLRVADEEEYTGLDLSQHSETAYEFGSNS